MPLANRVVVENEWAYRQRAAKLKVRLKAAGYRTPKYRQALFELIGGIIGWPKGKVQAEPMEAIEACFKALSAQEKRQGKGDAAPSRLVEPLATGVLSAEKHWGCVLRRLEGLPRPLSIEGRGRLG